jgi:hypothetical protein
MGINIQILMKQLSSISKVSKKFSLIYMAMRWADGIIELNVPMKLKCNILATRHDSLMKTST